MDPLIHALHMALSANAIGAVAIGSVVGLIFGSIPGLTYSMALALILPVTFSMGPTPAIALLIGTYIGGMTGGSVSAILIGVPGTPSAAATVIDGHMMAKNGNAGVALGTAVIVSVFGGLFSLVVMIVSIHLVAKIAITFGPQDIFALVFFGLSTICGLAEKSLVRGFIAGVVGLMLMTIGMDQIEGTARMTFGSIQLLQGINLLVAMIGLFAVPQILFTFVDHGKPDELGPMTKKITAKLPSIKLLLSNFWLMVRCAVLGTGIGAIPGTGGPVAAFLAYDHAKRFSKHPETFGKGECAGVVAPETANNAVTGGAMIPLLSLGIPGDPATAIVLGGLLIHGINPGPMLFQTNITQVYTIYIAIMLAYAVVLVVQLLGIRLLVRILHIPSHYLAVGILVMCVVGSYAIRHSFFDVYTMLAMGFVGYLFQRLDIPVTPVILGMVLGKTLENKFRMALIMTDGDATTFFTSGTSAFFLSLSALVIVMQVISMRRKNKKKREALHVSAQPGN
ncbi:tripartite tricarboxylate transporter permease [Varunaivibrio sulfuroxidans]|uniref:Putative tricarboxylic transport membrane protein n=1 Tax=Varunaivibrio sulfuroxidans TaxID=1773489 RepID=A0A4R3JB31_9PROT|nr:tripartite tricarboxylate transporter permease [Varunaivibrio sulfuroxidans]TCS63098.1 putative tricarboxylic transport membrane protein [Varunaivibrio sulfuroxidans]WES31830.1 tripartite tricarboxylate transporter permease [Varunaivibrio sulfuroxidans]